MLRVCVLGLGWGWRLFGLLSKFRLVGVGVGCTSTSMMWMHDERGRGADTEVR